MIRTLLAAIAFLSINAAAAESSLFYQLTFPDGDTAWLFASSHSGFQRDARVQSALDVLLSRSKRIAIENALALFQVEKAKYFTAAYKGKTYSDLQSSSQLCLALLPDLAGVDGAARQKLPPPAIVIAFDGWLKPRNSDVERPKGKFGWDDYIVKYAMSKHGRLNEIEAGVGQLAFFNALTADEVEQMVTGLCALSRNEERLEEREKIFKSIHNAYSDCESESDKCDYETLYQLERKSSEDYAGWSHSAYVKFIEGRSRYFAKRIIDLNRTVKADFFAVGATHFGGRESVITALRSFNVKIRPVRTDEILAR
jgi:uncharacterized protein YbaP (TraB family)